jgi:hypothetical protein
MRFALRGRGTRHSDVRDVRDLRDLRDLRAARHQAQPMHRTLRTEPRPFG